PDSLKRSPLRTTAVKTTWRAGSPAQTRTTKASSPPKSASQNQRITYSKLCPTTAPTGSSSLRISSVAKAANEWHRLQSVLASLPNESSLGLEAGLPPAGSGANPTLRTHNTSSFPLESLRALTSLQ